MDEATLIELEKEKLGVILREPENVIEVLLAAVKEKPEMKRQAGGKLREGF